MSSFTLPGPDIATNGGTSLSRPGSPTESLPTVVIGCMERLEEYQTLLTKLWEVEGKEKVRGEMVDRIVQNATQLPAQLHQIHMLVSTTQSIPFLPYVPKSTLVHFHPSASESSSSSSFTSNLEAQGWTPVAGAISHLPSGASSDQILSFTSPSTQTPLMPSSSTSQAVGGTVKLKKKSKAAKSSIWAAHSPMIEDPEKLLTAEDKKRPECVFPDPADGQRKRRKRACKDCTCGLKELEDEEFGTPSTPAFFIEGDDDIPDVIKNATAGVEKIWPKGDKLETAVKTSSCGSCYAGDAFRCGSCPYLGLPAFEPGQKIEIPVAMNDL